MNIAAVTEKALRNMSDAEWANIAKMTTGLEEDDLNGYFKTDDLQWCKKVSDHEFDLVEVRNQLDPNEFDVVAGSIDIYDYSDKEITDYVSGYYKDTAELKDSYPNDWTQIIAECIFEQTHEVEFTCFGPYASEDDAEEGAERYIKNQKLLNGRKGKE